MKPSSLSLLCFLSLFISLTICQQYISLTVPSTTPGSFNPCSKEFYTFSLNSTQRVITNYLEISIETTSQIHYYISSNNITFANTTTFTPGNPTLTKIDVICEFTQVSQWFLVLSNEGNNAVNYTITASLPTAKITALNLTASLNVNSPGYNLTNFGTASDFYSVSIPTTINQFSSLEITISPSDPNNTVSTAQISFNNLPSTGCEAVSRPQSGLTVVNVDFCTLQENGAGNYYIGVTPQSNLPLSYSISVSTPTPEIVGLTSALTGYLFNTNQVNYYSIAATTGNVLNITLTDIVNGQVQVEVDYQTLPFFECVNGAPLISQASDTTMQLIVDYCDSKTGTYYIGVQPNTIVNPLLPVTYKISYNQLAVPNAVSLSDSQYVTGAVSQNFYSHYSFSQSGYDITDQTVFNIHLYVDTYNLAGDSYDISLYVNYNNPAGPLNSCWSNVAACTIDTTTQSSCTVQINPCDFNEHQNWYVSIVASNDIIETRFVQYTVVVNLVDPNELSVQNEIVSSSVYYDTYDHYYLSSDIFTLGVSVDIVVSATNAPLTIYANNGGDVAGETSSCPSCYNNTYNAQSFSNTQTFTYTSCPNSEITEDFYFSLQGGRVNTYSSYTVLYNIDTGLVTPPTEVAAGTLVVVGSLGAGSNLNYTLGIPDFDLENQLIVKLSTQTLNSRLSVTLYNTTYLNCLSSTLRLGTCTTSTSSGYCTFAISPCVFKQSTGLSLVVNNPSNTAVSFNLEYSTGTIPTTNLATNTPVVNELAQYEYDFYTYEIAGGADSVIFEVVFFDDGNGYSPVGNLYISDEPFGDCFPTGVPFTCQDDTKCVYVSSSCYLTSQTFYIAIYTSDGNLVPGLPLKYSITATELNSIVPLPNFVNQQATATGQIYPGQQVYHTLTSQLSSGSVVTFQLIGANVAGLVSQSAPPTSVTCPCYQYYPGAVLNSQNGGIYTIEYCDQTSPSLTVLVEATSNTPAVKVPYTLVVTSFTSQPLTLTPGAPIDAQVVLGLYQYFNIPSQSNTVTVSITNIKGGSIGIYYSTGTPATRSCAQGTITCNTPDSSCIFQLPSCQNISSISVYGDSTDAAAPITFTISITTQNSTVLTAGTPFSVTNLGVSFTSIFSYTLTGTFNAPVVTFQIFNVLPVNANYQISVFTSSLCSTDSVANTLFNSISIPFCDISNNNLFFYVTSRNTISNFTATVTVVDAAATVIPITANTPQVTSLTTGQWITYSFVQPSVVNQTSLQFSVSPSVTVYFSNEGFPALSCSQSSFNSVAPFSVQPCCVVNGTYYVSFQAGANANYTVEVTSSVVSFNQAVAIGTLTTVNIPAGQLAEFTFQVPNIDYDAYTIAIESNLLVQASLQRISPAGASLGPCYSQLRTITTPAFSLYNCNPTFVGTMYVSVSSAIDQSVNFTVIPTDATALNSDGVAVPQTTVAFLPYIYTIQVPTTNLLVTNTLVVNVTSNNVSFTATIIAGDTYCNANPVLDTCTNTQACSVSPVSLCSSIQSYSLLVITQAAADITVTASIQTSRVTPLTATGISKPNDGNTVELYSFNVTNPTSVQYVEIYISYPGTTQLFSAAWEYFAPSSAGVYCIPATNDCQYSQASGSGNTICTIIIEPCELYSGNYILQVTSLLPTDIYNITYQAVAPPLIAIDVGEIYYKTVPNNVNDYYLLPFDRTTILPGETFDISLQINCGDATLYINQDNLAGPICSFSNSLTYSLSACQLLGANLDSSSNSDFYITIAGGASDFPAFNVPTQYSLSSSIGGSQVFFEPIATNQEIVFDNTQTIYTYNVAGINDFTGQLAFTLTYNGNNTAEASATIYIAQDTPYHTALPCGSAQSLTINPANPTNTAYFSSCIVDSVRIFYISFSNSSSLETSFTVSLTKQYVRDLNQYPEYPQTGAVVGRPGALGVTDEEYYEIQVNPSTPNFQFQATLVSPIGPWSVNLLGDLAQQPSRCAAAPFNCTTGGNPNSCDIIIDWCTITVPDYIYLTVNTAYQSNIPIPYNLTVSQSVTPVSLSVNSPVCGAANGEWAWYSIANQNQPNVFYQFEVYSISIGKAVNVYLHTQGLATNNCYEYQSLSCGSNDGACSIVYSCGSFAGTFSLGVQKIGNPSDVSYFVRVLTTTIAPKSLTLGTSQSSSQSTPSLIENQNYYFYSISTPTLNANQTLVLSVTEPTSDFHVFYNTGAPTLDPSCSDDYELVNGGLTAIFFINSCDYKSGQTVYVTVYGPASDFVIEALIYNINVGQLPLNSFVEGSLSLASNALIPSLTSYSFTLQAADIQNAESFTLSFYGINQGSISAWITRSIIADQSCAAFQNLNTVAATVFDSCQFTAGTYYLNILLSPGDQLNECIPVTFGALLVSNAPTTAVAVVPLTSGVAANSSIYFTNNLYTFNPNSPNTSLVTVTTSSGAPYTLFSGCTAIQQPVEYYFGCSAQANFEFTVVPNPSSSVVPNAQYQITATSAAIPVLSTTVVTQKFATDYESLFVYTFTVTADNSVEIVLDLTVGPSVYISILSTECDQTSNVLVDDFECYYGTCVVPVSQRQGTISNATNDNVFYVTVNGFAPSSYTISLNQGESQTCAVPNPADLSFCTIVTWSTWSYESSGSVIQDQDATAQNRFNYLYTTFSQYLNCAELSEECNTSLTEYVCTNTFRACDSQGFETSICYSSCSDVETNCGASFLNVGLPELSCNHNFYLAENDYICTDIYGVSGSGSDLLLWVVVGIVLLVVVVVLVAVAGVVIYKQVQAKRRASSYEVLE